jgi:hypothetical protein
VAVRRPNPLPPETVAVARAQEGLIDNHQLRATGVVPARITRNVGYGTLHRVAAGVYDLVPIPPERRRSDPDPDRGDLIEHRRLRGAWLGLLSHGVQAVAVGQTALLLHGVKGLPIDPVVEVTRLDRRERVERTGVTLRRYGPLRYVMTSGGRMLVPVTTALAQAVPLLGRRDAVAVMDSALHLGLVDTAGLEHAHDLARGRRGVLRTHDWWDLADARAESPAESWARLGCHDAGIPPDVLQQVFLADDGAVVARVDLAWWLGRGRWLLCEIDGRGHHDAPRALYRDRRRQNPLSAAGHVVLRFTGTEARRGVPVPEIQGLLERNGWTPGRAVPRGPVTLPRL